jgi:two-component system, NarL family, sensor kinase
MVRGERWRGGRSRGSAACVVRGRVSGRWAWARASGRSAVVQFGLSGVLATVIIGVLAVAVSRHIGTEQAIGDAERVTRLAGEAVIAPRLDDAVLRGDPGALRRLDAVVRRAVLRHGIVRVKVWSADARVIYSDEPRLIGRRFGLEPEERALLGGHGAHAQLSSLAGPESRFERRYRNLLEVYVPIRDRRGRPLVFEAYQRFGVVSASARRLWLAFAPALLGGLAVLWLITLPLGRALARRLREGQREREALLRRALDASESERRLIAADLHDGVVQDLVGASYSLEAEARRVGADGEGDVQVGAALRHGAAMTRDSARALRSLLVDIYPEALGDAGLAVALGELARTYTARGIVTSVRAQDGLGLDGATERLLFRGAQEAMRNVHKHARARSARITVARVGGGVRLEVRDDGRGCDADTLAWRGEEGHFGLRLLHDLVADAGGRLSVEPGPRGGTIVSMDVAAHLTPPAGVR